jgi:hypothetical protein
MRVYTPKNQNKHLNFYPNAGPYFGTGANLGVYGENNNPMNNANEGRCYSGNDPYKLSRDKDNKHEITEETGDNFTCTQIEVFSISKGQVI